jgi:chaperone BCS1
MNLQELLENQVLTGIVGGSLMASLLFALKGLPRALWDFLVWRFTTEIVVFSEDAAFGMVSEWLGSLEYAKRARQIRLTSEWTEHEQQNALKMSPGLGLHLIWYGRRPVFIRRNLPNKDVAPLSRERHEDITIRILGAAPALAREIVDRIVSARSGSAATHVEVFLYRDHWRLCARKVKRAMDTVVMPDEQRRRILGDVERFRAARDWYGARGIPYRRGLLLTGPPGTGKTSLVFALASHFSMRVYALNLGSLRGDVDLIDAVTSVPENAILLIEDIDAAQKDREALTDGEARAVTMSGLLNAIDGVFSRDGRVLVMTTNHPDKLDQALKRPGRADLVEHMGDLGMPEVRRMCRQFLGHDSGEGFALTLKAPIRPAELQRRLLAERATEALQ